MRRALSFCCSRIRSGAALPLWSSVGLIAVAILLGLAACAATKASPQGVFGVAQDTEPAWLGKSRQLIVVVTPDWTSRNGLLHRFVRTDSGSWELQGDVIPVIIGKKGLGWGLGLHDPDAAAPGEPEKKEGDGRAPAGAFSLPFAFAYDSGEISTAMDVLHAGPDLFCVDDPASDDYNTLVRWRDSSPPWNSAETMHRADGLYRFGVFVAHNPEHVSGRGSCIFMHIEKKDGAPTVGCTSMRVDAIKDLIRWLTPKASPVLVQLPQPVYSRLKDAWGLPAVR